MDASGYSSAWSPLICGFSEGEMTMTKQLLLICVLGLAALTGKGLAGEINGDDEENTNDQLVLHLVAPPATDPAIDRALDNHYVWLDRAAPTNHKLLVFMPGTGLPPAAYQLVQREAARLGYHVIGLMYPNRVRLASACPPTPDPDACFENARLEILDGIDRSPVVDVNEPNSIDNRLTKLLQYLTVLFSSVPDKGHTAPATPWVATHVTPAARYWGLAHDRDALFPPIQANWDSIGMAVFGAAEAPETSEPPYDFTHVLVTDLVPQGGSFSVAHGSTVGDAYTPRGDDGTPILRDAWRYLLTAKTPDEHDADDEDETDAI